MSSLNRNLYCRLKAVFAEHANKTCIHTTRREWTYADLTAQTQRTAGALRDLGIGVGDRVLVQGGKCPEVVALYLACLQLGAIYVPLNTAYTTAEVEYFVKDTDPELYVHTPQNQVPANCRCVTWSVDDQGKGTMLQYVAEASDCSEIETRAHDDTAAILYTSGTTGKSKGAMLTHRNLESNADALIECWHWQPDDILLHALPMYHVHGLFVALHCVLLTGTEMIWHEKFDVDRVIGDLPRSTVLMGVPTFYLRLLSSNSLERDTVANMRLFISGSAPLSEQTFAQFEQEAGFKILERYGMSETLMNTSNPYNGERIAGTVGYPLSGVESRIVDDSGGELETGEIGEIELRGPNVFKGYWRKTKQTEESFREDGFFCTGDLGFLSEDGRLSIAGRAKDVIISGGLNIYPAEIETALDGIEGVVESAVVGAPHPDFGEGVVAVLVATREIQLKEVKDKLIPTLASFKHPKALFQLDELPRNAMGKIQKQVLRGRFAETFTSAD